MPRAVWQACDRSRSRRSQEPTTARLRPWVTVYSQADAADIAATWVDLVDEVSTYGVLVLCNCCLMVGMVASMACVITGDEDDPSMIAGLLGVCTLCGTVVLAIPTFIYLIMIWLDDDDLEVPCGGNEDFESIDSVVVFACVVSPGCLAAPLSDQLSCSCWCSHLLT